jgi:hypothetical protein
MIAKARRESGIVALRLLRAERLRELWPRLRPNEHTRAQNCRQRESRAADDHPAWDAAS